MATKAAIYARVSTLDQAPENQLQELRQYVQARSWTAQEYVDRGISGAKDRRPALDALIRDAKRRKFDVLVCWRLDRLGRSLKHLVTLLDELHVLGIAFVSLAEGIDATTPAGKLQMHILAAIVEFERERIRERVMAGLQRARGKAGSSGDLGECFHEISWPSCEDYPPEKPPDALAFLARPCNAGWPKNLSKLPSRFLSKTGHSDPLSGWPKYRCLMGH